MCEVLYVLWVVLSRRCDTKFDLGQQGPSTCTDVFLIATHVKENTEWENITRGKWNEAETGA